MNSTSINIPKSVIASTIESLREAGGRDSEGIVLWLATPSAVDRIDVVEAYVPLHDASRDYFRIPPEGMTRLVKRLGEKGTFVAAQVHSHPKRAFHSLADDEWAVVRHAGALSLVLPYFASRTKVDSFVADTALFTLTMSNEWIEITEPERSQVLRVV